MIDKFSKNITLQGTEYKFHNSIKTTELEELKNRLDQNGLLTVFNQVYGRITTNREVRFRKILNGIIKAKNNPLNKGKSTVIVRLNDKSIKLRPLLYKV